MKPRARSLNCFLWAIGAAYTIFLIVRLFRLIDRYSVNILWWDNFNYYFTLAGRWNYWERFTAQLGPHREGAGLLLSSVIAPLTRWNMRAEAFAVGVILVLALITCLVMKARAFRNLAWYDLIILSSLFLSAKQYEIWCITVNSSHCALPLLFLMLYCLGWTLPNRAIKDAFILSINFLSIFTGFGFFLGLVTPVVFAILRNVRAVVISLASLGLFFVHYKFDPANSGFRLLDPRILKFPEVVAIGLSHYFNFIAVPFNEIFGYGIIALVLVVFIAHVRGVFSGKVQSIIAASLIGFTILYIVATVEGRISLGLYCLTSSRYIPLLTPGFLGAYLSIPMMSKPILRGITIALAMMMALYAGGWVYSDDRGGMESSRRNKLTWIAAFQRTGDLDVADAAGEKPIYPHPRPADFEGQIEYLRVHRLNFFTLPGLAQAPNPSAPPAPPGLPP
jgi:hypothetical protein